MIEAARAALRRSKSWVRLRELGREGYLQAYRRWTVQRLILGTRPLRTAATGPVEVRILSWRRDWLNALWALKSFYHFSGVDYPLHIHDGGLEDSQLEALRAHFPDARLVRRSEADREVARLLGERGLSKCLEYRAQNVSTLKLFDFFLLSRARFVLSIDSDIVFFRKPEALLLAPDRITKNLFNRDMTYYYSMEPGELEQAFGIRPPPLVNSGLSLVARESLQFDKMNEWLKNPKLFANKWVTEQTLHALSSTLHGLELLSDDYLVSTEPGLSPTLVCKHYPGFFRPLLYQEGMRQLAEKTSFLRDLTTP